jgi:hypothetical protein
MSIKDRIKRLEQIRGSVPERRLIIYETVCGRDATEAEKAACRAPTSAEIAAYKKTIDFKRFPVHIANWDGLKFIDKGGFLLPPLSHQEGGIR